MAAVKMVFVRFLGMGREKEQDVFVGAAPRLPDVATFLHA